MRRWTCWTLMAGSAVVFGCGSGRGTEEHAATGGAVATPGLADKVAQYTPVRLTADLGGLTQRERRMIPILIDAVAAMDTVFRQQYYPALDSLLATIGDSSTRRFLEINYGPW